METQTPQKKKRRFAWKFTRRSAATVVALMMLAAPAGASIIVQNYMEADIVAAPPCFNKTAGADAVDGTTDGTDELVTFDGTATDTIDGVTLTEEKITVQGMTGDRVIYTDVAHFNNDCDSDIVVQLTAQANGTAWTGVHGEIWLSNIEDPTDVDPSVDVLANEWNDTAIEVTDGAIGVASTGAVTVPAGQSVQAAFVLATAPDFAGTATINWVAEATISTPDV